MLEIFELTQDNIEEVAKRSGRRPEDLRILYQDSIAKNKVPKICVDVPDIPEGYGRVN